MAKVVLKLEHEIGSRGREMDMQEFVMVAGPRCPRGDIASAEEWDLLSPTTFNIGLKSGDRVGPVDRKVWMVQGQSEIIKMICARLALTPWKLSPTD